MLCDLSQAPYPTARRILKYLIQIEAFALEHPLRQAGAQTTAPILVFAIFAGQFNSAFLAGRKRSVCAEPLGAVDALGARTIRVGVEDAAYLVREFQPKFQELDLLQLPNYRIYLNLMINGTPS